MFLLSTGQIIGIFIAVSNGLLRKEAEHTQPITRIPTLGVNLDIRLFFLIEKILRKIMVSMNFIESQFRKTLATTAAIMQKSPPEAPTSKAFGVTTIALFLIISRGWTVQKRNLRFFSKVSQNAAR